MTTVKCNVTAISTQAAKPSKAYGYLPAPLVIVDAARPLVRATIPAGIPANAVVSQALLVLTLVDDESGSVACGVQRNTAPFSSSTTWNTSPSYVATASATQVLSSPSKDAQFTLDVTSDVQAFVSGTAKNYGWRVYTSTSVTYRLRGSTAWKGKPYLLVTYDVPAAYPTDLNPSGGSVATGAPTLTFQTSDDAVSFQVQVDAAQSTTAPGFDSGEVVQDGNGGVLNLAGTSFAALANGATTYWRARYRTAQGWGPWSGWASFTRRNYSTLTVTNPGAVTEDPTPPVQWTFAGTQTAWRAQIFDATGKVLDDSGKVAGTATAWTPDVSVHTEGATGTARVDVWDAQADRQAVAGFPVYASATQGFTFNLDATVDPMDTLTATQDGISPRVHVTGRRAVGVPDSVLIYRDGSLVANLSGPSVFVGTALSWEDWHCPQGGSHVYTVQPVVNGSAARGGPRASVETSCKGIWLVDTDTFAHAVIWGDDPGEFNRDDVAVVHQPIGGTGAVVRRRLVRPPMSGKVTGVLLDVGDYAAGDSAATLDGFGDDDAGAKYHLILGGDTYTVIVGNMTIFESPLNTPGDPVLGVSFDWWGR